MKLLALLITALCAAPAQAQMFYPPANPLPFFYDDLGPPAIYQPNPTPTSLYFLSPASDTGNYQFVRPGLPPVFMMQTAPGSYMMIEPGALPQPMLIGPSNGGFGRW